MMDDFNHLDLEVGAGPNPTVWSKITDGRTEGVDRALLGVWNTTSFPAGRYTLRLTVYDSLGNTIQRLSPVDRRDDGDANAAQARRARSSRHSKGPLFGRPRRPTRRLAPSGASSAPTPDRRARRSTSAVRPRAPARDAATPLTPNVGRTRQVAIMLPGSMWSPQSCAREPIRPLHGHGSGGWP